MEITSNTFLTADNLHVRHNFAVRFEKSGCSWHADSKEHNRIYFLLELLLQCDFILSNIDELENVIRPLDEDGISFVEQLLRLAEVQVVPEEASFGLHDNLLDILDPRARLVCNIRNR